MTRPRAMYQPSLARLTTVGAIAGDHHATATAIRKRLDSAARGDQSYLTVFVADGAVYATRATSPISAAVKHAQIIGLYTHRARVDDIADDIEAWRAAA